jgi:predicted phage tail protein
MIRTVQLHGELQSRFGGPFLLDVATAQEAVRALVRQLKGFRSHLAGGDYRLIRGPIGGGKAVRADALAMRLGASTEFHIVPVLAGSASSGVLGEIITGLALVASALIAPELLGAELAASTAVATVTKAVFAIGVTMTLSGVAHLISPTPKTDDRDNKDSFLFSGQINTTAQGGPVPTVYGQFLVGSVVVSAGVETQEFLGSVPSLVAL